MTYINRDQAEDKEDRGSIYLESIGEICVDTNWMKRNPGGSV